MTLAGESIRVNMTGQDRFGENFGHEHQKRPLEVLVVDDSAVVREVLSAILSSQKGITVTTAADPIIAMAKMDRARPDVILLDLQMPRMDGLTFLRRIMAEDPIPVVICSSQAETGTEAALRALEEGAVDIISKPKIGVKDFLRESSLVLIDAVWGAARARLSPKTVSSSSSLVPPPVIRGPIQNLRAGFSRRSIIAIGASTGGTEALRLLLEAMPKDAPGIVIVQHMPQGFTAAFARRLNELCVIHVKEAADGDLITNGKAFIAAGNRHLLVRRSGADLLVEVTDGPLVTRHRPSVDVLFRSVARVAGPNAIGVILTGMGSDGASGLLEMKQAGAATIAQDESTSVVFGMPKESISKGAVDEVVALPDIPSAILRRVSPATGPLKMKDPGFRI